MGYETCTCADCGRREAMDLSREVRFAGEYGPLCDDCLSLALRVVEANAKDNADPAPDPALLALAFSAERWEADESVIVMSGVGPIGQTMSHREAHRMADWLNGALAPAIAVLLTPDGAGEAGEVADTLPVCHWAPQGTEPRVTSCGRRITFNLGAETCPSCGGRVIEDTGEADGD